MDGRRSLLLVLLLFGLLVPVALAGTTGKISGRVIDPSGEPLPGVQIVIEGTSTGTVTDIDGYYDIINVRPGTYALVFKYVGFADTRVQEVEVTVDKTTTIDVTMREEVIEGEEVVVTAERPLVQVDRTTTTSFVDEAEIEALPVSNISDVINLQAGVVDGHFRGGRTGEVAYLINGVPINNPLNNNAAFDIEKNMVSGLEIISGVFNAEYGQAMSGIVNVVTKDAPSAWSGSISTEVGGVASGRELEYIERTSDPGAALRATDFQTVYVPYYEAASPFGRRDPDRLQMLLGFLADDPTDRQAAMHRLYTAKASGEILTGLLYFDPEAQELHDMLGTTAVPLNALQEAELCPGNAVLEGINRGLR